MQEGKLRFIHAADLHLDSPFTGLSDVPTDLFEEIRQSTFNSFDKLIKRAIEEEVDFILLVGDLFDNEKQSLKAQVHLKNAFLKLAKHQIMVFLSYGNHDYLSGNTYPIEYPENVKQFKSEEVTRIPYFKNNRHIADIHGFSYLNQSLTEGKISEYKIENKNIFNIGMLHGALEGERAHSPYAPFSLAEIKSSRMDYWALGHVHERRIINQTPRAIYPGNIQGRHKNEQGSRGSYLIELEKNRLVEQFIPLHSIMFKTVNLVIKAHHTIHDIQPLILQKVMNQDEKILVNLVLESESAQMSDWEKTGKLAEVIDLANHDLARSPRQYIYAMQVLIKNQPAFESEFTHDLMEQIERLELDDEINELITHPIARKHLSKELFEQADLKERTKAILKNKFR